MVHSALGAERGTFGIEDYLIAIVPAGHVKDTASLKMMGPLSPLLDLSRSYAVEVWFNKKLTSG